MHIPEEEEGWEEEEEEEDYDGVMYGERHGVGYGDGKAAYGAHLKPNARSGVQLPSLVQPQTKRHRHRSKAGTMKTSNRGGAVAEAKKDVKVKLAELDDFDTRVSYFHTTSLKQRLAARGWGGDDNASAVDESEQERPPTVLTNPSYAAYFT